MTEKELQNAERLSTQLYSAYRCKNYKFYSDTRKEIAYTLPKQIHDYPYKRAFNRLMIEDFNNTEKENFYIVATNLDDWYLVKGYNQEEALERVTRTWTKEEIKEKNPEVYDIEDWMSDITMIEL